MEGRGLSCDVSKLADSIATRVSPFSIEAILTKASDKPRDGLSRDTVAAVHVRDVLCEGGAGTQEEDSADEILVETDTDSSEPGSPVHCSRPGTQTHWVNSPPQSPPSAVETDPAAQDGTDRKAHATAAHKDGELFYNCLCAM